MVPPTSTLYDPAAQAVHTADVAPPATVPKAPAAHGAHTMADAAPGAVLVEYDPAAHAVQALAPSWRE